MFERPALPFFHPATLIATWFGVGLIKGIPGTWGSLAALPCAYIIVWWGGLPSPKVSLGSKVSRPSRK